MLVDHWTRPQWNLGHSGAKDSGVVFSFCWPILVLCWREDFRFRLFFCRSRHREDCGICVPVGEAREGLEAFPFIRAWFPSSSTSSEKHAVLKLVLGRRRNTFCCWPRKATQLISGRKRYNEKDFTCRQLSVFSLLCLEFRPLEHHAILFPWRHRCFFFRFKHDVVFALTTHRHELNDVTHLFCLMIHDVMDVIQDGWLPVWPLELVQGLLQYMGLVGQRHLIICRVCAHSGSFRRSTDTHWTASNRKPHHVSCDLTELCATADIENLAESPQKEEKRTTRATRPRGQFSHTFECSQLCKGSRQLHKFGHSQSLRQLVPGLQLVGEGHSSRFSDFPLMCGQLVQNLFRITQNIPLLSGFLHFLRTAVGSIYSNISGFTWNLYIKAGTLTNEK